MMAVPVGIMISFVASGPGGAGVRLADRAASGRRAGGRAGPDAAAASGPKRSHKAIAISGVTALARIPALWWITLSGALVNFMMYSFSYFVAAFLTRFHGLSVAEAGVWSGLGSGAAGIAGALAVVAFGGRLRLAAAAALVAAPLAWAAIRLPRGTRLRQSSS